MHVCMYIYMRVCIYIRVYDGGTFSAWTPVCIYMYIHTHIYIHTYIHIYDTHTIDPLCVLHLYIHIHTYIYMYVLIIIFIIIITMVDPCMY